jgi:predicted MFS family arabinose efflux permease
VQTDPDGRQRTVQAAPAASIVVGYGTVVLLMGGMGLFLPLIREDFGLTFSQAGALAVAMTAVYAAMQIPSGYLADRFGSRRLFVVGLAGSHLLALTLTLLRSYELLLVNQALIGFTRALAFTPGLLLIAAQFAPNRRATAMGLYSAGSFAMNVVLNLLGPVLVVWLGWRGAFAVFACGGLAAAFAVWQTTDESSAPRPAKPPPVRDLVPLLGSGVLWLMGIVQFVRLAIVQGMAFWMPSILVDEKGFALATAGMIIAVGAAFGIPAVMFGGLVSDRLDRPLTVIAVSLTMLAVTTASIAVLERPGALILAVAIQALFIQVYFGPLFALPVRYLGPGSAGTTSGFSNLCANLGALTAAWALGVIRDATGSFAGGLYALAGMCLLAIAVTFSLRFAPRFEAATTEA